MLPKIEPQETCNKVEVKNENAQDKLKELEEAQLFLSALSQELGINIEDVRRSGKAKDVKTPTFLKGCLTQEKEHDKQSKSPIKREPVEEMLPDNSRPSKRPRLIPVVLLSTWSAISKRRYEDYKKIKAFKNPKMKCMKNLEISLDSIYDRLKPYGFNGFPIGLDIEIQQAMVSRQFMSNVYGGNSIVVYPKIGEEKFAIHGMDDFMYLNAAHHTYAPQLPGKNGLFFHTRIDVTQTDYVFRLFTRIEPSKWLYVGMYVDIPCPCLSKDEWCTLPVQARNAWVNQISKRPWGAGLRARVIARKDMGRNPTYAEWQAVCNNGRYLLATPEDVKRALDNGDENLQVSVMKCVGYDEPFQKEIVEGFANWVPPAPNTDNKKTRTSSKEQPKTKIKKESTDEDGDIKIKKEEKFESKDRKSPPQLKKASKTTNRTRPEIYFSDDEATTKRKF